ncbi:MAG: hypothetical protein ACRC28_18485 [Clostridium sp.]
MIDSDFQSSLTEEIFEIIREAYGRERTCNIGTLTTQATRSTIIDVAASYGISRDIASLVANAFPKENNVEYTMYEAFYGKGDNPPSSHFKETIIEVFGLETEEEFEEVKNCMLDIRGLVSNRSSHSAGIIMFPKECWEYTPLMRTPTGTVASQYTMEDVELVGGVKYDILKTELPDLMRAVINLLLENKKIEWKGSLRETYQFYFHPDKLEYNDPKLYELFYKGEVVNCFQFSSTFGESILKKLNARNFDELCAANMLMRIKAEEGEQPIDKYIRFRDNNNLWEEEMDKLNIKEGERKVLRDIISYSYGVCTSQEDIMTIISAVANYDETEANKFRKLVAKQKKEYLETTEYEKYIEKGLEFGRTREFLDYVWEYQFRPSFDYSFSKPHTVAYTLCSMIEAYVCYKFGTIWWKTACLTVDAGITESGIATTDFGKIAIAATNLKEAILPPHINESKVGFTPSSDGKSIRYSLKGIMGLSKNDIPIILEHQPYTDVKDFVTRTKLSLKKCIAIAKSGAFDCFGDRKKCLMEVVRLLTPQVKSVGISQLNELLKLTKIDNHFKAIQLYRIKQMCLSKKKKKLESQTIVKMAKYIDENHVGISYDFDDKGQLVIEEKSFEKVYDSYIEPLKLELKDEKYLQLINRARLNNTWREECLGTTARWEMQSLNMYFGDNEIDSIPFHKYFSIKRFSEMTVKPEGKYKKTKNGNIIFIPVTTHMAGVVINKNIDKGLITLLTSDGVVTTRIPRSKIKYYDENEFEIINGAKKIKTRGWFEKGTILVVEGFRDGDMFINRKSYSSNHSVVKVLKYTQEDCELQTEKFK